MSDHVLDLLTGGWKARAVASATRSGVFDALCREPADSVELAHRLNLHQPTTEFFISSRLYPSAIFAATFAIG